MTNKYVSTRQPGPLVRIFCTGLLFLVLGSWLTFEAQAQVSGRVFRDFNANGAQDTPISSTATAAGEPGLPGVTVTAYDANGGTASIISGIDGSYSFPNSGVTAAGTKLRLEFTTLPVSVLSGASSFSTTASGTSIQFLTAGATATGFNYAVNYPGEYCQSVPLLATPCFVSGQANGTNVAAEHVLVTFPYSAQSTNTGTLAAPVPTNNVNPTPIADAGQVGSVWGMAYQRETKKLFTAAFLKRHVGLGSGGLGGIYVTNNATGSTTNGSLYVDLESAPFSLSLGQVELGTRPTIPNSDVTSSTDPTAFTLVGKAGLGSMALSEDGSKLYIVDLYNRQLLVLAIGNPAKASLSAGDLTTVAIPATACTNGVSRPFGVSVYRGKVYVGVVCTAESAGGTAANLNMAVYVMDEASPVFGTTPVLSAPLTYPKGYVHAQQTALGDQWEPWTDLFSGMNLTQLSAGPPVVNRTARPQPLLSDIDFTDNGDMVLSLMDRTGHQLGYRQVSPTGGTTLYNGYIGGDLLRARNQAGTWVLESAARVTSATLGSLTGCGPTNNQGPGGGEFYCNDNYVGDNNSDGVADEIHQETNQGGSVIIPGTNATVSIHMDPMATWSGGMIWHSNSVGSRTKVYQLYRTINNSGAQTNGTYGKANGLGLPVALCDPAPVEIGNRVWLDTDQDGSQDPNETPIASVTVGLYESGTLVASAVTNAEGEYYFSSATGTNPANGSAKLNLSLIRGGIYELRIATAQPALASYVASSPTNVGNDLTDNDFAVAGADMVTSLTLGTSGDNVHAYDAAVVCQLPLTGSVMTTPATCNGTTPLNNGLVTIPASLTNADRYSIVSGTVTTGFAYSTATALPGTYPANLIANAPNAGGTYTVRLYNGSTDCYVDQVVVVNPFSCTLTPGPIDLSVTKTRTSAEQSTVGGTVTFNVIVKNNGLTPATNVLVNDLLDPADFGGVSGVGSQGAYTAGTGNWTVGTLSAGASATLTVTATVLREGISYNTASLSGVTEGDINSTNNVDRACVTVPVALTGNQTYTASVPTQYSAVEWFRDGVSVATGNSLVINTSGVYTFTASNGGCAGGTCCPLIVQACSLTATAFVNGTPIDTQCANLPATLTAQVSPAGSYTYAWTASAGATLTGANTATATTNALPVGTYSFTVTVSSSPACFTTAVTTLTVTAPPNITLASLTVCEGQSVTWAAMIDPVNATTAWKTPACATFCTSGNPLVFNPITLADGGTYLYQATDANDCSTTATATMTVQPRPVASITNTTEGCSGGQPLITVSTQVSNGTAPYSYTWTLGGQGIVSNAATGSFTAAGSYTLVVSDANGCVSAPVTVSLTAPDPLALSVQTTNPACANASGVVGVTILGGVAPYSIEYEQGASVVATSTSVASGVADQQSLLAGTYQIVVTDANGCSLSQTATLTQPTPVTATVTVQQPTCGADGSLAATASGGTGLYSYTWSQGATVLGTTSSLMNQPAGTYTLTVRDANGCLFTQDYILNPPASAPTITLTGPPVCEGNSLTVTAQVVPAGTYTYAWSGPVGAVFTPTNAATATVSGLLSGTHIVTVTVTTAAGCISTKSLTVTINDIPDAGPDQLLTCAGGVAPNSTTLAATALAGGAWSQVGTLPATAAFTNPTSESSAVTGLTAPGTYTLVWSANGCTDQVEITVPTCLLPASLGDYVWLDTDKNGQQDPGESGVGSVTVVLCDATSGTVVSTAVTDGTGFYSFTGLAPNSYIVKFTAPVGTTFTTPNSGTDATDSDVVSLTGNTGATAPVTVTAGENNPTIDAGLIPLTGSIGDFVWKDTNANGIQDAGEPGLTSVTVKLLQETSTPGQFTVVATTVTSAAGLYSFTGLTAANYKVKVDLTTVPFYCQPTAQTVVTPSDATNSKIDPSGLSPVIVLNPANPAQKDITNVDAGFKPLPLGSIGDYVWKDTNNDGIQNDGTTGVPGVGMKLLNDELYVVQGVLSGTQEVPTNPTSGSGLVYATFDPVSKTLGLKVGFNGLSGTVTMAHIHTGVAGANGPVIVDLVPLGFPTGVQAGNFAGSVTLAAAQETLLMANKLYVNVHTTSSPGGEVRAQLTACQFTDANGNYLFANLPSGTYTVAVDTKTFPTTCVVSSNPNSTSATDGTDSDFDPTTFQSDPVTIDASQPESSTARNNPTVDLALAAPLTGSIGDLVWKEVVQDGSYDAATESGVANVTVRLLAVTSPVGSTAVSTSLVSTTLTDGAGKYLFANLPAGRYVVEFVKASLPATCELSPDFQMAGVPDSLNSDANPTTGQSPIIEIVPTDPTKRTILTVDAALIVPGCKPVCVPISVVRKK